MMERATGLEPRSLASLFKGLCPYDGQTSACYPENLGELLPQAPSPRFRSLLEKKLERATGLEPRSLASLFKGLCPYDGQTSACYPENLGEPLPQAPSPRFRSLLEKKLERATGLEPA